MKNRSNIQASERLLVRKAAVALAALLCAGCSKIDRLYDEVQPEIAFRPADRQVTRSTGYPEGSVFGVFAYHTEMPGNTPWASAWESDMPLYLDNAAFRNGTEEASGWNPSANDGAGAARPYYWPLSGSLLFGGYSPHSGISGSPVKSVTLHKNIIPDSSNPYFEIAYDMPDDNSSASMTDKELLYFDMHEANTQKTVGKREEALAVTFRHALSLVSFKVSHDYESLSIKLTECVDKGVFYSGFTAGWVPDRAVDGAGKLTAVKDYVFAENKSDDNDPVNDGKQFVSEKYVIPQYTNGWFEELKEQIGEMMMIVLTINDEVNGVVSSETVEIPLYDYVERLEMGKKYILNLTVRKNPVVFGPPEFTIRETTVTL